MTNAVSIAQLGSNDSSFKNRIINGAMAIWQRGTSISNSAGYTADRFFVNRNGGGGGITVSRSGSNPDYWMKIQRDAGNTSTANFDLRQVIETLNCGDLAGQTVTLSFSSYKGTTFTDAGFTAVISYSNTVDDAVNAGTWVVANSTVITPTTSATTYTLSASIPTGAKTIMFRVYGTGYVGTAGADDSVYFRSIQIEKGSTATSFDYRSYTTELQLCQRYYEKSYNIDVAPASVSDLGGILHRPPSTSINVTTPFKVAKRASPSITVYSPVTGASSKFRNYTSGADLSIGGVAFIGMWAATPYSDASTANNQYGFQFVAESEL